MTKAFKDMISCPYDGLTGREEIEWSNLWWDKANQKTNRRYLLVGDSTMRMVRSTFAKITNSPVDMIGSSSDVDDILFISLVDAFFSTNQYKYDAIFVQLGHHSRTSKDGGVFSNTDLQRFMGGGKKSPGVFETVLVIDYSRVYF